MGNTFNKTRLVILGVFLAIAGVVFFAGENNSSQTPEAPTSQEIITEDQAGPTDNFSYQGKSGVDALTILEEAAAVEKDPSGLVVSINGRSAHNSEKEFWAFYVNGGMSQVGPAEYITSDTDEIEWKIENY